MPIENLRITIEWMCKQLEISRAAYYKWLHREAPYEELENIRLAELIKENAFVISRDTGE